MPRRITEDEHRIAHALARRTLKEKITVDEIASNAYNAGLFPNRTLHSIRVLISRERTAINPNLKRKNDEPMPTIIPIEECTPDDVGKQYSMFDGIELDEQIKAITVRAFRILVEAINEFIDFMEEH